MRSWFLVLAVMVPSPGWAQAPELHEITLDSVKASGNVPAVKGVPVAPKAGNMEKTETRDIPVARQGPIDFESSLLTKNLLTEMVDVMSAGKEESGVECSKPQLRAEIYQRFLGITSDGNPFFIDIRDWHVRELIYVVNGNRCFKCAPWDNGRDCHFWFTYDALKAIAAEHEPGIKDFDGQNRIRDFYPGQLK